MCLSQDLFLAKAILHSQLHVVTELLTVQLLHILNLAGIKLAQQLPTAK